MYRRTLLFILAITLTSLSISCSDTSTGSDPEPEITTGTVEVKTATTGDGTDEDGYSVTLNNNAKDIEINGTVTFEEVEEGTHSVELSGLGMGCTVDGDNPVSVDVVVEETTSVAFQIVCEASTAEGIIAFSQTVDQQFEIFTMNADGTNQQQLTSYDMQDQYPAISPDGQRIVFVRQDSEGPTLDNDIWVMNIDGSNPQRLTGNTVDDKRPVWSPDGSQIAYESGNESFSIWVMNADGSNQSQITDDNGQDTAVSWSTEGDLLAFVSNRQGDDSSDIYTINADGTELDILIDANSNNGINLFDPAWSHDGSQIAYQGFVSNGALRIFIANADGSNAQMIQPDGYSNARQPSWSPDGNFITFLELASSEDSDAIWIVETDNSNPVKLTDDQTNRLGFPNWGVIAE